MSEALEISSPELVKLGPEKSKLAAALGRFWPEAIVVALVVILWAPRTDRANRSPVGRRRLLCAWHLASYWAWLPNLKRALQYPPFLPAFIALHQLVLGTTNSAIVAPRLRTSYARMRCWRGSDRS
jgi:uncharacterized protein involved in response to NO